MHFIFKENTNRKKEQKIRKYAAESCHKELNAGSWRDSEAAVNKYFQKIHSNSRINEQEDQEDNIKQR